MKTNLTVEELQVALSEGELRQDVITKEMGIATLQFLSKEAADRISSGWREITRGILCLELIREYRLHDFCEMNWGEWIDSWVDSHEKGRSTVLTAMKALRIWKGGLGRNPLDLLDYAEGVSSFIPVVEGEEKIITDYNRKTGEIRAIAEPFQRDGQAMEDVVNEYVDTLPKSSTRKSTTRQLRADNPSDEVVFEPTVQIVEGEKTLVDLTFEVRNGGKVTDRGYSTKEMSEFVRWVLYKRLRVERELWE